MLLMFFVYYCEGFWVCVEVNVVEFLKDDWGVLRWNSEYDNMDVWKIFVILVCLFC